MACHTKWSVWEKSRKVKTFYILTGCFIYKKTSHFIADIEQKKQFKVIGFCVLKIIL
jgi:hypothetical protein